MATADPTIYPKAKYHVSQPPYLAHNPEEEAQLGAGWYDHPDQALEAATAPLSTDSPVTHHSLSTLPSAEDLDADAGEKDAVEKTDTMKKRNNASTTLTS